MWGEHDLGVDFCFAKQIFMQKSIVTVNEVNSNESTVGVILRMAWAELLHLFCFFYHAAFFKKANTIL